VFQGLFRRKALLRIYNQTFLYKINEVLIVFAEKRTSNRVTAFAAAFGHSTAARSLKCSVLVKKVLALVALIDHFFGRHAYAHDEKFEQLMLVERWEQRASCY